MNKYTKYKTKYLQLKNMLKGGEKNMKLNLTHMKII